MDAAAIQPAVAEPFFSEDPVQLDIGFGSPRKQSRVTVAFRPLLVIPHLVVLFVLSIPALPLLVVGWFAALILGRLPKWIARYEIAVLVYSIRINAYLHFLVNEFPPFSLGRGDYPLRIEIGASRLSRLKVLFRLILMIPANFVAGLAGLGLFLFNPIIWIVTLVLGRMPQALFGATAAVLRFQARLSAYATLVTDEYPHRLLGDDPSSWAPEGAGRELRVPLSGGARTLVWIFVLLGIAWWVGGGVLLSQLGSTTPSALVGAEVQFEADTQVFVTSARLCAQGAKALQCAEHRELVWSRAFDRFAVELEQAPLNEGQQALANALAHDSTAMAGALRVASQAKGSAAYLQAWNKVQKRLHAFEVDAKLLFGHSL